MALDRTYRPLCQCIRSAHHKSIRALSTSRPVFAEPTVENPPNATEPPPAILRTEPLSPYLVHTPRSERKLIATKGIFPIGSRRRRAAIQSSTNIPFHQLPYQCFQEARKVLLEDRQEKVQEIQRTRERIGRLEATKVEAQDEGKKEVRLRSMRKRLEELKILADVNDPLVKKTFEDGQGKFETHWSD
jgi:large subunit ribosomal protein L35